MCGTGCVSAGTSAANLTAEPAAKYFADTDNDAPTAKDFGLRHSVEYFVRSITRNPGFSDNESLVRWNSPICLLAAGFLPDDTKIVSERLFHIISAVGAPLAKDNPCKPNFVIVTTAEPNRVMDAWYARDKQLFGDASPLQIRHFLSSNNGRPIRVWRNIDFGRTSTMRLGHFVPSNSRAESSPFIWNEVLSFYSIFVIVDARLVEHVTLEEIADYVAMTGLSNVDLDADVGSAPTILRLFASSDRLAGLSLWDTAFLAALYQSDQHSRTQRHDIAERVILEVLR